VEVLDAVHDAAAAQLREICLDGPKAREQLAGFGFGERA